MTDMKLVIVGNGMAAGRMIDELHARIKDGVFEITVIGDEVHGSYNRIMLSPVLAGETDAPSIVQKSADWYAQHNITFLGGVRVESIDRQAQTVNCNNGEKVAYDHLIMATGSRPAKIPAKNQALAGVMAFRTLDDVEIILAQSQTAQNVIVVGGGLLGLEAAYGIAVRGMSVTLIHRSGWLLNRQLDARSGEMLAKLMQQKGVTFRLATEINAFNRAGDGSNDNKSGNNDNVGHVASATLSNGEQLPCDLVVIATGITPNAELGFEAGLAGSRAIEVDDYLSTSDPNISAIGECIEHRGKTFGLVEPIWQHCITVADRLVLGKQTPYQNRPVATKLKVSGVQVFSAGEWLTSQHHHEYVYCDASRNIYRKLLLQANRIVGIVFFGDVRDGQYFFDLMQNQIEVAHCMPQLLMGRAFYAEELPVAQAACA